MKKQIICILLALAASAASAQDNSASINYAHHVVKASIGPSLTYTKMFIPILVPFMKTLVHGGNYRMYNLGGVDATVSYQYFLRFGLGIGVDYTFSRTWMAKDFGHFSQHYIGPEVVYAYRGWKHWGVEAAVGVGYIRFKDNVLIGYQEEWMPAPIPYPEGSQVTTQNALGVMARIGTEYRFNKHWAIGLDVHFYRTSFRSDIDVWLPAYYENGFSRVNAQLCAHYIFK